MIRSIVLFISAQTSIQTFVSNNSRFCVFRKNFTPTFRNPKLPKFRGKQKYEPQQREREKRKKGGKKSQYKT